MEAISCCYLKLLNYTVILVSEVLVMWRCSILCCCCDCLITRCILTEDYIDYMLPGVDDKVACIIYQFGGISIKTGNV